MRVTVERVPEGSIFVDLCGCLCRRQQEVELHGGQRRIQVFIVKTCSLCTQLLPEGYLREELWIPQAPCDFDHLAMELYEQFGH